MEDRPLTPLGILIPSYQYAYITFAMPSMMTSSSSPLGLGPIDGDFGSPDDETLMHALSSRHHGGAMILVLDEGESAILRLIGEARIDDCVDDAVRESTHLVEYVRLGHLLRYAADEESTVVDGHAYAQRSTAAESQ